MNCLVSILIPCYNYGNIVKRAVKSALTQTYTEIEIIVIDDGSTDPVTLNALEEIKKLNVQVIHQSNQGLGAARNTGVEHSKGNYLFFLDNDDYIHARTIEVLLNALHQNPEYAFAYAEMYYYGNIPEFFVWKPQHYNFYNLVWANHPTLCSVIKREAHEKAGGFSENLIYGWEDWEYWLKLSKSGHKGLVVNLPLYYYWRHGKTMAHTVLEDTRKKFTTDTIVKNNPEIYNGAYISNTKKQSRPIVTVIISDDENMQEVLSSVFKQTIFDKQIIILTAEKDKVAEALIMLHRSDEDIVILDSNGKTVENTNLYAEAFLAAKGEFTFLLRKSGFYRNTSLEEALWKKIFDKTTPFHYYIDCKEHIEPHETVLPENAHKVGGMLIETSLLCFAGGLDNSLSYEEGVCDLLLKLISVGIKGTFNSTNAEILHNTRPGDTRYYPFFNKYPQLSGFPPNLAALNTIPLKQKPANTYHNNEAGFVQLKNEILSELSYPHYSDYRNQRFNFPSIINPALSKKTILYLVPYMVKGGAEKVDLDILSGLKREGFRIIIVSERIAEHKWENKFRKCSDEIYQIDTLTGKYEEKITFLEYLIIARNVSLIFIRSSAIGYQLARGLHESIRAEIAIVDLLHAYNRFGEDWIDFSTPFDKYIDERIVITENLKNYLADKAHIKKDKINVFYNGIDIQLFINNIHKGTLRKKLHIANDTKIIGFIGRLVEDKQPLKWLEVAAHLNKMNDNLHFIIAGDGDLESEVEKRIKSLKIKNITLLGWQNDVHQILDDFDVLLMTSRNEGFPLVIMEALCAGVQVVAPKLGGISEILNNKFSEVLEVDASAIHYANSIQKLLMMNSNEKEVLKKETLQFLKENFDIKVHQQRYIDKLNSLISKIDLVKREKDTIKHLILHEFIKEDYRFPEAIYSYQNLQEYYVTRSFLSNDLRNSLTTGHIADLVPLSPATKTHEETVAEWYYNEYEVLPMWYKRFGHLVKAFSGKRSFKSLIDDKAKGYDASIGVQEWYNLEYEANPLWYKRFGHIIKVLMGRRTLKSLFK